MLSITLSKLLFFIPIQQLPLIRHLRQLQVRCYGDDMALLAESVVDEWMNRQGFFTIRGVKHGVNEMDILAVRPERNGCITGWHVEVQVSFRPVGYITPPSSARTRSAQELSEGVDAWIQKKFLADSKRELREQLWPHAQWSFHFVHGVVREHNELNLMGERGLTLHPFHEVLQSLCVSGQRQFSCSSGGDLLEIVQYYEKHQRDR